MLARSMPGYRMPIERSRLGGRRSTGVVYMVLQANFVDVHDDRTSARLEGNVALVLRPHCV